MALFLESFAVGNLFVDDQPLNMKWLSSPFVATLVAAFSLVQGCAAKEEKAPSSDLTSIEGFIEHYFSSWTEVDFQAYGDCFHPSAIINFVSGEGVAAWGRGEFVASQEKYQTAGRSVEIPLEIHPLKVTDRFAFVDCTWELTTSRGTKKTGTDWFHLVRDGKGSEWKVLYLSFWYSPANAKPATTVGDNGSSKKSESSAEAGGKDLRIVVSGFGPFGGRKINASSELAKAIKAEFPDHDIDLRIVPVEWGAPYEELRAILKTEKPDLWIAFGEGTKHFRIETVADNRRGGHRDVLGELPRERLIAKGGPGKIQSGFPSDLLREKLENAGYDCSVSQEAGDYLCEEMLYTLLHGGEPAGMKGLFIHVPILGKPIRIGDREAPFTGDALGEVARDFFPAIVECVQQTNESKNGGEESE